MASREFDGTLVRCHQTRESDAITCHLLTLESAPLNRAKNQQSTETVAACCYSSIRTAASSGEWSIATDANRSNSRSVLGRLSHLPRLAHKGMMQGSCSPRKSTHPNKKTGAVRETKVVSVFRAPTVVRLHKVDAIRRERRSGWP